MSIVIDVYLSDGPKQRYATGDQNGEVEVRQHADGSPVIMGVRRTREIRNGGGVVRRATRTEEVVGTRTAGSRVGYVGRYPVLQHAALEHPHAE